MHRSIMRRRVALLSLSSLLVALVTAFGGAAATASATGARASALTTSSLGKFSATFAGPAATGCATGCSLLSGPLNTPSTAGGNQVGTRARAGTPSRPHAMALPNAHPLHVSAAATRALTQVASFPVPSVSCQPLGPGCDRISTPAG